ncbi:hypothetical protein [Nocardioides jensenii]|uniref:hypothetical protein n=1 Tax=Nocardioides jensenii TaxID=1843 RepID=UPI000829DF0E|nr:hypothetical protein [Nocardioides jensenii]
MHPLIRHRRTALLLLALAAPLAACGDDEREHNAEPLAASLVEETTLDNGTEVRVSSPDNQKLFVQFREKDDGWTEPTKVHEASDRWTHGFQVESVGDSVAIDADYWRERELDDDYAPEHTVQVICHETTCADAVPADDVLSTTRFDDDGEQAWFLVADDTMSFWSLEQGSSEVALPELGDDRVMLARGDGTLLLLSGREEGPGCATVLYAAAPGSGEVEEVAATATHDDGRSCAVEDAELHDDEVRFTTADVSDDISELDAAYVSSFVLDGDSWRVEEAESQRIEVPDSQGDSGITTLDIDLPDGSTVSISSTDREHVTAQVLESGSDSWSRPEVVAVAPSGTVCRAVSPTGGRYGDTDIPGAMVMVTCGADDNELLGRWRPTHGILLATDDGHDWLTKDIDQPGSTPLAMADGTGVAHGSNGIFTWHSGQGRFTRLGLAIEEGDGIGVTPDGSQLVRFTGNHDPDELCRPTWSLADPDAAAWGRASRVPKAAQEFPQHGVCVVEKVWAIGEDGRDIIRTVIFDPEDQSRNWTGGLAPDANGEWRALESSDL